MNKNLCVLITAILLTGCVDPLSRYIQDNNYYAIVPPTDAQFVGNVYGSPNISANGVAPIILLPDAITQANAQRLMAEIEANAGLPNIDSNSTYEIGADVEVVGYISAALEAAGVSKFSVQVTDAKEYVLSQARFRQLVNNEYQDLLDGTELDGKYYIYSLLKVGTLKYDFFSNDEAKIAAETLENLETEIETSIGPEWEITEEGSLVINTPMFIGARLSRIEEDSNGNIILQPL